jgi:hypothetical protein
MGGNGSGRERTTWTAERINTLTRLAATGMSMLEIAREMGLTSRSMVGSAIRRYGIVLESGRMLQQKKRGNISLAGLPGVGEEPKVKPRGRMVKVRPAISVKPQVKEEPKRPTTPVKLLDLEDDMCRWPVGNLYCGAKVNRGAYCATHARMSYVSPRPHAKPYHSRRR